MPFIQLGDEASCEAEPGQCAEVSGCHRWFFLPVMGAGPALRAKALYAGRVTDLVRAVEPVLLRERTVVTRLAGRRARLAERWAAGGQGGW